MRDRIIACVVEGEGEIVALPRLLHRIAHEQGVFDLRTPRPLRVARSQLVRTDGIENAVRQQALRVGRAGGGVLVVLDSDDDCPAALGPALLRRAEQARSDVNISVVLPSREFESWFLAAAGSLAGLHGFPVNMKTPHNSDHVPRDAKGWLSRQRGKPWPYKETIDQAVLASVFDLGEARKNSPSFDKFWRDVSRLLLGPAMS